VKKNIILILFVFFLFPGCASVKTGFDPRTAKFPTQSFTPPDPVEKELKGGARLFYVEDHEAPLVRIYVGFRGGSLYDPPDKSGLSELTQSAWRTGGVEGLSPEEFDESLENRGMQLSLSLGRESGWASVSMLSEDMAEGIDLLAKLLLRPTFNDEKIAWSATKISESIRRETDDPETLAYREFRRAAYRGHPRGSIPTVESIQNIKRDDIIRLHKSLISESTWIIGAVGDFHPGTLLPLLNERLGGLPGSGTGFAQTPPPPEPKPTVILVPKELAQSTIVWGRLGPASESAERYGLELADFALGSGGFQSRLMSEIRSNRGLAYSVGSFYQALPNFGVIGAYSLSKTESTAEVLSLIKKTLEDCAVNGFGGEEIAQAKEAIINQQVFRYEDPANMVKDKMSLLLNSLPPDLWKKYPEKILAATDEDADAAAKKYYQGMKGVLVIVGGAKAEDIEGAVGAPVEALDIFKEQ